MEVLNHTTQEERTNSENLNLLSIFYFAFGGLSLLGAFILFIYMLIIGLVFSNNHVRESLQSQPEGEIVGTVFSVISVVFIVLFVFILAVGIMQIMAGFRLRQKRSKTFIMVVAIIALLSFPLGTALGVFTIIVLSRSSVDAMFKKEKEKLFEMKYGEIG
jgi:hypothetical protein